jgi:hypothetical protein
VTAAHSDRVFVRRLESAKTALQAETEALRVMLRRERLARLAGVTVAVGVAVAIALVAGFVVLT